MTKTTNYGYDSLVVIANLQITLYKLQNTDYDWHSPLMGCHIRLRLT